MTRIISAVLVVSFLIFSVHSEAAKPKEWTLLVFLNGNNNLDSFGAVNIKQLETVGSTKDINLVVQWASAESQETKRLLVKKSSDATQVTSPIVETLPRVDMGDYNKLVEFVKWGMEHYPAKHYFIDVWDHGSGWHRRGKEVVRDISHDAISGHKITTKELGIALSTVSQTLGRKIDILGMDACLMSMTEVATEVSDSVDYMISSQELEPGAGWPYNTFIAEWAAAGKAGPTDVSKMLVHNYVKAYLGSRGVTLSSLNLSAQARLNQAVKVLGEEISRQNVDEIKKIQLAASTALKFNYKDYTDLGDLVTKLHARDESQFNRDVLIEVENALKEYVVVNETSPEYSQAKGVSIWWPDTKENLDQHLPMYQELKFWLTGWGDTLRRLF